MSPRKQLYFYESGEWEEFVLEWVGSLEEDYDQVKRFAGPGDRGIDVAGLCTPDGLEGAWDCYQCKHYAHALTPSNAHPEILKIMLGVLDGEYTFPRRYRFVAPRGCGTTLNRILSTPTKLRAEFLSKIKATDGITSALTPERRAAVIDLAESADYSVFDGVQVNDLLEQHRTTPFYHHRFGEPLPPRPEGMAPPDEPTNDEALYVEKLLDVYREEHAEIIVPSQAMAHGEIRSHFRRQRESFYSAESLRMFARDSLPVAHYRRLQENIYDSVVETCEAEHPTRRERLRKVLDAAVLVPLSSGLLVPVTEPNDKKGICHQLANDDRLNWRRG